MSVGQGKKAWVCVLTRSSYLAATVLLAYSLRRVKSRYPLYVLATPALDQAARKALRDSGCSIIEIDPLRPQTAVSVVATRFVDTWDKLRVFGLVQFDRVVLLDADMLVFQNMDELMDIDLPEDGIGCNHACLCNWSRDAWAQDDWRPWNCAWTKAQITGKRTPALSDPRVPHGMLNSGLVVCTPSESLFNRTVDYLNTSPLIKTFSFPDQDFMTHFFAGRWVNVGWEYNAIKTARYWHPKLWSDGGVKNLHYIVAKPWMTPREKWTAAEGDDRTTHGWWWHMWGEFKAQADEEAVKECERHMLGEGVGVGQVESWEQSVEHEKQERIKEDKWPPGEPWGVINDGVEY